MEPRCFAEKHLQTRMSMIGFLFFEYIYFPASNVQVALKHAAILLTIPQSTTMQAHMEPRCFTQKDVQRMFLQIQIAFDPLPAMFLQEPETLHVNVYDQFCS